MPRFTEMRVEKRDRGFSVRLSAECRKGPVDYTWSGRIEGTSDGRITFHAAGTPGADFRSNRIGLCVLYGTSLVGEKFQAFESSDGAGEPIDGEFPLLVSPSSRWSASTSSYCATPAADSASPAASKVRPSTWRTSATGATAPLKPTRRFPYQYPDVNAGRREGADRHAQRDRLR